MAWRCTSLEISSGNTVISGSPCSFTVEQASNKQKLTAAIAGVSNSFFNNSPTIFISVFFHFYALAELIVDSDKLPANEIGAAQMLYSNYAIQVIICD